MGKYVSITPPTEIVQTWSLKSPTWPSGIERTFFVLIPANKMLVNCKCKGHFATLTTSLVQSSDSTKVTFTLDGVPTGMEEEIRRNLEGY